jgi:hypothetical protein
MRNIQHIAMISSVILLLLVGSAEATYTIDPETKGWAISDITDESYQIRVVNTDDNSVVMLELIPQMFTYVENVSVFRPVPPEMMQYITFTPKEVILAPEEEFFFTVHISFPDLTEMYGHTWEYRLMFNDTNKYNYREGGEEMTQHLHIVRMYLPTTRPVVVAETPFYVYPFMIIFSLIFLGGIIIYLKRRSVPLALRDHENPVSEWAGMQAMPTSVRVEPPLEKPVLPEKKPKSMRNPIKKNKSGEAVANPQK